MNRFYKTQTRKMRGFLNHARNDKLNSGLRFMFLDDIYQNINHVNIEK